MTINYDENAPEIALKEKSMDLGWIGKFIGSGDQARFSITLIIMIILLFIGTLNTFIDSDISAENLWALIVPILTLGLGYIFGQTSS